MADQKYDREKSDIHTGTLRLPEGYAIPDHDHHMGTFTTVRSAVHHGKEVRVETTYKITIDGQLVTSHVGVADDGSVHTHGLPNYTFASALDLGKRLAETSHQEFPENELTEHHGGHH